MSGDSADQPTDRGRSGPLLAMLICFGVLCAGSVGAAGYFVWRAAKNAADRAEERRLDEQAETAPGNTKPD